MDIVGDCDHIVAKLGEKGYALLEFGSVAAKRHIQIVVHDLRLACAMDHIEGYCESNRLNKAGNLIQEVYMYCCSTLLREISGVFGVDLTFG